jgi:hypothetical protein
LLFGILLPLSSVRNHIQLRADFGEQVSPIQLSRSTRSEGNWVDTFALICVKQIARGISHQQGRFYVSLEGLLGSWRKEGFLPAYLALLKRVG